jgi:hypothetical protein
MINDQAANRTAPLAPENVIPEQAGVFAHHLIVEHGEADYFAVMGRYVQKL